MWLVNCEQTKQDAHQVKGLAVRALGQVGLQGSLQGAAAHAPGLWIRHRLPVCFLQPRDGQRGPVPHLQTHTRFRLLCMQLDKC